MHLIHDTHRAESILQLIISITSLISHASLIYTILEIIYLLIFFIICKAWLQLDSTFKLKKKKERKEEKKVFHAERMIFAEKRPQLPPLSLSLFRPLSFIAVSSTLVLDYAASSIHQSIETFSETLLPSLATVDECRQPGAYSFSSSSSSPSIF